MRFRSVAVTMTVAAFATGGAQGASENPTCVGAARQVQDACQQAVDMFQLMMPQLGLSIVGGNATLGQGSTLGGLPHFALDFRGNVLLPGSLPELQTPDTTGAQQRSPFPTKSVPVGLPAVDAAIGLFKGLPLALTNVGGVDLLLSASYVPNINHAFDNGSSIDVSVDSPLKFGYGVRVGLLQESLLVPGVSVTYFIRDLPTTTVVGSTSTSTALATVTDTIGIRDFSVKTKAWRIVASKSLLLFGVAAGFGQDKYDASTTFDAVVRSTDAFGTQRYPTGAVPLSQNLTRSNMFADVTVNLFLLKLVGEIGRVSGGTVATFNTFDPTAASARTYGAAGVRFGF
jgi:hypothetical protein